MFTRASRSVTAKSLSRDCPRAVQSPFYQSLINTSPTRTSPHAYTLTPQIHQASYLSSLRQFPTQSLSPQYSTMLHSHAPSQLAHASLSTPSPWLFKSSQGSKKSPKLLKPYTVPLFASSITSLNDLEIPDFEIPRPLEKLTTGSEKNLDEFTEATQILQLAQMQRRAILEEQMMNEVRSKMTLQEKKEYEYRIKMHRKQYGDTVPLPYDLADTSQNDPLYMASQILSPDEAQKLHNWYNSRAVHSAVVQFLTDDVANYIRSFCYDDFFEVLEVFTEYLPRLLPHYLISPMICNLAWNFVPKMPKEMRLLYPAALLKPFYWIGSFIRSGNILVDLRCAHNLGQSFYAFSTWCGVKFVDRFPQFYKYFGYYCLYPFAWALHVFGDKYLLTHVIQSSMAVDDRRRELDYQKKFNPPQSVRDQVRSAIDAIFPMFTPANHDPTGTYDAPTSLYDMPDLTKQPANVKPLL